MVAKTVYVLIGQDHISKDIKIRKLRQEFLDKNTEQFNLDILYGKELSLKTLQEKLLCLPLNSKTRIVIIKEAQELRQDVKEFILNYAKTPYPQICLVLDINTFSLRKSGLKLQGSQDEFLKNIARYSHILHFKEAIPLDAFTLNRQINLKKTDYALRILNQLLKNGEPPERIMGGLRYSWQRDIAGAFELRKRIGLLLNCDLDIKTGRLKPDFALEKLVVKLCCL